MHNLANRKERELPWLDYGEVVSEEKEGFAVHTSFGAALARTAAGCLVRPRTGDRVLLCVAGDGECYVLSVLERAGGPEQETCLEFDGNVSLHAKGGDLSFTADRDLTLASEQSMALASRKVSIHAGVGEAVIEHLSVAGRALQSRIKRIRTVASSVEQTARRFTQRLRDSFRYVEDQDEVQCGSARYLVEDSLTLHSKNTVHMAEEIVTINAEQVHLG